MIRECFISLIMIATSLLSDEQDIINLADQQKIYKSVTWKALLHYDKNPQIKDKKYLLSKKFSLKNELESTINAFFRSPEDFKNINQHPQCRFPARFLYITHELNISKSIFPKVECKGYELYNKKAPSDNIYLVYASEKVNNPSSMMGHTFLKFTGKNYKGIDVKHAITFYTVIDSQNPLSLIYQNMVSGMKGMFALQPYSSVIKQYTQNENRNVWEYKLKLTKYQKQLIRAHVWELKDVKMKYYFTKYNCSTIIYYILSLVKPAIYHDKKLWVTPLDTVKYLYKYKLIDSTVLKPSDEWIIHMLTDNLEHKTVKNIKNIAQHQDMGKIDKLDFYSLSLLDSYVDFKARKEYINQKFALYIKEKRKEKNYKLDISKYKSPSKIPPQRELEVGYNRKDKENYLKLSFLGASHFIDDYNKEYFGESELKIGYLSLLLKKDDISLDEFTLYSMKSYMPYNILTKDLSYQLEITTKKDYTSSQQLKNYTKIDAGVGIVFRFGDDINSVFMINTGIGYNSEDKSHIFVNPSINILIYEVFNMKSLLSYEPMIIKGKKVYDRYLFKQNIFMNKNYTISGKLEYIDDKKSIKNYEIGIKYLF